MTFSLKYTFEWTANWTRQVQSIELFALLGKHFICKFACNNSLMPPQLLYFKVQLCSPITISLLFFPNSNCSPFA